MTYLNTLSPAWVDLSAALVPMLAREIADCVLYADYVPAAREHGWDPNDFELTRDDMLLLDGDCDYVFSSVLRHIRDTFPTEHKILVRDVQRRVRAILRGALWLAESVAAETDAETDAGGES